eukprot:TRINITY_DN442_c0_g1_i11.p2 TRINITY_DN442_c0_g1~~TRINITY_DN442_c0_g1_i11.p2  ORF type:complete len:404 (+),score=4.99 TRINITY_DN442_c0_g1_i11:1480-2691(+)
MEMGAAQNARLNQAMHALEGQMANKTTAIQRFHPGPGCLQKVQTRERLSYSAEALHTIKPQVFFLSQNLSIVKEMLESIKVKFINMLGTCPAHGVVQLEPRNQGDFSTLYIALSISCTVKGNAESLLVVFTNPSLFADVNGVQMIQEQAKARLRRSYWIDSGQQAATEAVGNSFQTTNYLIYAVSLGRYLFQQDLQYKKYRSVALGAFWSLMNMLQILYYLPAMNIYIPENLRIFLTTYLGSSKIEIPIPFLDKLLPTKWVSALTSNFDDAILSDFGLDSYSVLINFYEGIFTWVIFGTLYIIVVILDCLLPKGRFMFIRKWKEEFKYNFIIRMMLETFLDIAYCSILNLWKVQAFTNTLLTLSYSISAVFFVLFAFSAIIVDRGLVYGGLQSCNFVLRERLQ